jgi:Carbohydrate binding module (family 6)
VKIVLPGRGAPARDASAAFISPVAASMSTPSCSSVSSVRVKNLTSIFGTAGSTQLDARVASGAGTGVSGLMEVVLDSPTNAPVGSFAVGNTGGWTSWETIPANITKVTGTHNT